MLLMMLMVTIVVMMMMEKTEGDVCIFFREEDVWEQYGSRKGWLVSGDDTATLSKMLDLLPR